MSVRWRCLMYHDVLPDDPPWDGGPGRFAVSRSAFERQLDVLRGLGLLGCSLEGILDAASPERRVAISFDDGYLGQFEHAFPALVARGMTATFFVATAWVGQDGFVSWGQLRQMKDAGMSIQSHTRTHPFLSELGGAELRAELAGSKADLDRQLSQRTRMIALPGGDRPQARRRHLIREVGYDVVATSRWGDNRQVRVDHEPLHVRRCTIQGDSPMSHFRRVLAGDAGLGLRRRLRESALGGLRRAMGPSRYSRLRRDTLDAWSLLRRGARA